jgi:cell division initiation protein
VGFPMHKARIRVPSMRQWSTEPLMPDQSSAATEHAILSEITAPLATLPDDPVAVLNVDFPLALRGYDRLAVDEYVKQTSQLVAEIQATRSPEAAVRRALERVGEQISGILQRAHEAAGQITTQSRSEAEDRLEQSRREATQITQEAEQRVKDLDADTDRIWAERHRIVDDARGLAAELLALAEAAAERFPPAEEAAPEPAEGAPASYDVEASAGGLPGAGEPEPGGETGSTVAYDVEPDLDGETGSTVAYDVESGSEGETGSTVAWEVESAAAARSDLADQPPDDPPDWQSPSTAAARPSQSEAEADSRSATGSVDGDDSDAGAPPAPRTPKP